MAKKETKKPEKTKEKKGKDKKGEQAAAAPGAVPPTAAAGATSIPTAGQSSVPLASMSPDQMTMTQIEQALKESNDPESRLKKLRSPINVRSCLLNILVLIVLTLGIVILWCYLAVDKFDFGTVFMDMMDDFGISKAFKGFWAWLSGLFS